MRRTLHILQRAAPSSAQALAVGQVMLLGTLEVNQWFCREYALPQGSRVYAMKFMAVKPAAYPLALTFVLQRQAQPPAGQHNH